MLPISWLRMIYQHRIFGTTLRQHDDIGAFMTDNSLVYVFGFQQLSQAVPFRLEPSLVWCLFWFRDLLNLTTDNGSFQFMYPKTITGLEKDKGPAKKPWMKHFWKKEAQGHEDGVSAMTARSHLCVYTIRLRSGLCTLSYFLDPCRRYTFTHCFVW